MKHFLQSVGINTENLSDDELLVSYKTFHEKMEAEGKRISEQQASAPPDEGWKKLARINSAIYFLNLILLAIFGAYVVSYFSGKIRRKSKTSQKRRAKSRGKRSVNKTTQPRLAASYPIFPFLRVRGNTRNKTASINLEKKIIPGLRYRKSKNLPIFSKQKMRSSRKKIIGKKSLRKRRR